jgi:hypothetical protein
VSPANASSTTDDTPTLTTGAFSDPNTGLGDTHIASQYQIAEAGSDWATGQDSGQIAATTNWTPSTPLASAATYQWRARYLDAYGMWSDWSTIWTVSISTSSISISVDIANLNLGTASIDADTFGTTTATVTTTNPAGYELLASSASTGSDAMNCSSCPNPLIDWTGSIASPTQWPTSSHGYAALTVRHAPGGRLAKWGVGTNTAEGDITNNYYGATTPTSTRLHINAAPTAGDAVTLTWRINAASTTSAAVHTETMQLTALANP